MSLTFVLSLIQDVQVLSPLVRFALARGDNDIAFLMSHRLVLHPLAEPRLRWLTNGHATHTFASTGEALQRLSGRAGLVLFASESRSAFHRVTHALAAALPSRFICATLQHGYECLGFVHNAAHRSADAGFAADIVCGWFGADRLTALPPRDRAKLMVTGSTMFLDPPAATWLSALCEGEPPRPPPRRKRILVCENVQSVRLAGPPRVAFMEALAALAARQRVVLRPHPAGPFAGGEAAPPRGVSLDMRPIETADLSGYAAAISPPSTVLFDLMRHEVPVALWRDHHGIVDDRLYGPLPRVCAPREWHDFVRRAGREPMPYLIAQRRFLRELGFPADTRGRFSALLDLAGDVA